MGGKHKVKHEKERGRKNMASWVGEEQEHRFGESSKQDRACGRGKKVKEFKNQESGEDRGPSCFLKGYK